MFGDLETKMTMVYWKSDRFWLGKLLKHPEVMTQGESPEELEGNIRDAYLLMAMDEVPSGYQIKEFVCETKGFDQAARDRRLHFA